MWAVSGVAGGVRVSTHQVQRSSAHTSTINVQPAADSVVNRDLPSIGNGASAADGQNPGAAGSGAGAADVNVRSAQQRAATQHVRAAGAAVNSQRQVARERAVCSAGLIQDSCAGYSR